MRANGYYWVRGAKGSGIVNRPFIAQWFNPSVWIFSDGDMVADWAKDSDFDFIAGPIPEPYIPVPSDGPKQVFGEDLED